MIKQKQFPIWSWLAIIPAIILLILIGFFSVNVPWFDDFDPFLEFPYKWLNSSSWSERIRLLFAPNNEHRMVFGKLLNIIYYYLTGTINFTYLHYVGFLFTLGTAYLFFKVFRTNSLTTKEFLPVSLLLFQWQYHLIFLWAICSLQHQPVVFFIVLTMYLLAQAPPKFIWAIISAFCANFSMSNGILVWAGGTVILFYRREYLKLLVWLACGATAVALYFWGMTTLGNEASIAYLKAHPDESFFGFFTFLGGLFDLVPDQTIQFRSRLPIVGGMVLFAIALLWQWKIWKDYFKKPLSTAHNSLNLFLLGVFTFIIANATIIALLRPRFGFFVMLVSNYKLYPALYMSVVYGAVLYLSKGNWRNLTWKISIAVSLGIWIASAFQYGGQILERRKEYMANAYNQRNNGFGLGFEPYSPSAKYIDSLLKKMADKGIYRVPAAFDKYANAIKTATTPFEYPINVNVEANKIIVEEVNRVGNWGYNEALYVFLRSPQRTYIWRMPPALANSKNVFRRYRAGHRATIDFNSVLPAVYEIGILSIENNVPKVGIVQQIEVKKP